MSFAFFFQSFSSSHQGGEVRKQPHCSLLLAGAKAEHFPVHCRSEQERLLFYMKVKEVPV